MLRRSLAVARWERFFNDYNLLICPNGFGPAFKRTGSESKLRHEDKEMIYSDYILPFVDCFNASGHPAMNIPLGLGAEGLPLGVQIVGPYWSERELLAFSKLATELTGGFQKPASF